ncbi:hypothetical protein ISN44_As03g052780 [Arabidopsis suecica]|uniref:Uncharacterized protein n=1 Tax=Arabidopsis suecica TaxID=45249 RepID=A0A8T2FFQ9_ARASU|nr:hypothetical protein ISN44_As03g052780 [Arabidopsis suecica]
MLVKRKKTKDNVASEPLDAKLLSKRLAEPKSKGSHQLAPSPIT